VTDGNRRYWLMKSEPETFSYDDLENAPGKTTHWNSIRNFKARNFLRDDIKPGDGVLFYHSNADPPGIAGIAEVVRGGYPDHTAFDPNDEYYDPKSSKDNPLWYMVDIRAVRPLERFLSLDELRTIKGLEGMSLLKKGNRLSVQPVTAEEWETVLATAKQKR
jgi:predicted RNA-binding protein with PUA-like domain